MAKRVIWFLTQTRPGRRLTQLVHPRIHPGVRPLAFQSKNGCWLCRYMSGAFYKMMGPEMRDATADRSRITLSEPEYDANGTLIRAGVSMSATVKRQLDEIMKGPDGERVMQAINDIAEHPEQKEKP